MKHVSKPESAGTQGDPPLKLASRIGNFVERQARPINISAAPDSQADLVDLPGAKFVSQAKQVLPAIEIASHHEYFARIFSGKLVEVREKVGLRSPAFDGLPK